MSLNVTAIFLSSEFAQDQIDTDTDSTDVIVELDNGGKYLASFFTFRQICDKPEKFKESGAFLKGKFFWAPDMVLVQNCERKLVTEVIQHLLEEGDFLNIFKKIN